MKIATLRLLLMVVDIVLVGAIAWVVSLGLKAKEEGQKKQSEFAQEIRKKLDEHRSPGNLAARKSDYGSNLKINISGKEEKAAPPPPTPEPPKAPSKPPLDTIVKVIGIQSGTGEPPSIVYLARAGAPATNPAEAGKDAGFYSENERVEWAHGAVIKKIGPKTVLFDYDSKEVTLTYVEPEKTPAGPGAGGAAGSAPAAAANNDPKTWFAPRPPDSGQPIVITPTGVASLKAKGDEVLAGVRTSTEKLPDGKHGIRIDEIPPNSALSEGGAAAGDVLHSINGIRMSSKAEVVQYVKDNPSLTRFEVKFFRGGVLHTRTVNAPPRK